LPISDLSRFLPGLPQVSPGIAVTHAQFRRGQVEAAGAGDGGQDARLAGAEDAGHAIAVQPQAVVDLRGG